MDETTFEKQLVEWGMKVRTAIVPTNVEILLYGHTKKTKVIKPEHEHLVYQSIKPLEMPDELYTRLTQQMGLTDVQCLHFVQKNYEDYLKDIRKQILNLQKDWSRNFCHFRANQVCNILGYENLIHICDLTQDRLVPIELILKVVFGINSKYGDHRRIKTKDEVFIDSRVQAVYNELQKQKNKEALQTS